MEYQKFENHIVDVIKEEQLKLGYRSEVVRLYYPLPSLAHFFDGAHSVPQIYEAMPEFLEFVRDRLGVIEVSNEGERFCLAIPPEGVDYVHDHLQPEEFICDFIETVGRHGCTMEDMLALFHKHSDHVHVEKMTHGEFDYLVYFEDGTPDDYRYCLTDEGCHIIYHRFTPEDYEEIGLDEGNVSQ